VNLVLVARIARDDKLNLRLGRALAAVVAFGIAGAVAQSYVPRNMAVHYEQMLGSKSHGSRSSSDSAASARGASRV
jgi:hypothetical protein